MRINASNQHLPGVQVEATMVMGAERQRHAVYVHGVYVGEVVYVARKTKAGTAYGWRRAKAAPQSALTDQLDAIRAILATDAAQRVLAL